MRPIPRLPLLLLLTAFAIAQEAPLAARVDELVAGHLTRPRAVGLTVGVLWKGELFGKGYGRADAEFDVRADADTMFRIGSITKQFTAALVLRAVEQGKVALDDPLSKFVPELDTGDKKVTVRHLLDHTSGIKSYTDLGPEWERQAPLEVAPAEMLALVRGRPFDFEPGAKWHYNNTGYYLLGMLVEKVFGKSYAEVVDAELCTPLGLSRTRYDSNRELLKNRAQGYEFVDGTLCNDEPLGMSQPYAAGALLSTGKDLVRWAQALAGGNVVAPASYQQMTTPTVLPDGSDTHYGFGLMMHEFAGLQSIGHGGGIHGFNSTLLWLPAHDFYVAVVCNSNLPSRRVAEDLVYGVLGLERPKAEDRTVPAELAGRLVGSYRAVDDDFEVEITVRDGKLYAQGKGQSEFRLLYQGQGEFRAEFDAGVKLEWKRDGSSFRLHQGGGILVLDRKPE